MLYYAVSSLGSQNSAIGLATSPSMEEGTWTDHGAVITSQTGDVYNASMTDLPYLFCVKADVASEIDIVVPNPTRFGVPAYMRVLRRLFGRTAFTF